MGPRTLEALETELDRLIHQSGEAKGASASQVFGSAPPQLEFRIRMLQAVFNELVHEDSPPPEG